MIIKRFTLGTVAMLAMFAFAQPAAASGRIEFVDGTLTLGGSGCPMGTAHPVVLGDQLIVTFDQMKAPTATGSALANCTITAGIKYGPGLQINLAEINYFGQAIVNSPADMVSLTRRGFFAGTRSTFTTSRLTSSGPFLFTDLALFPTITSCGRPGGQALVGATIMVSASGPTNPEIDLAELDAKLSLVFRISTCGLS